MYNANKFFLGAEYANDTVKFNKKIMPWDRKSNMWQGAYVVVGGTFSSIQPVYRFDYIDYTSLSHKVIGDLTSADTEIWHTFAINYKVNDNVTLGLDYVVKSPEQLKRLAI
jgi:phosphate-selective porin